MSITDGSARTEPEVSLVKREAMLGLSKAIACGVERIGKAKIRHAKIPNFFISKLIPETCNKYVQNCEPQHCCPY